MLKNLMGFKRNELIRSVVAATENPEIVVALWESGSASFNRTDEFSAEVGQM
ncbi:MAG: hypothetical protein QGG69_05635 [Kiritimatiellia bacterium]|nr:hypothetical protein [Kiritimatiellia bacterium]